MQTLWDKHERSIQEAFYAYCAAHPESLQMFRRFAEQWRAAGHTRCSADMILHRMRWETGLNKDRKGGFKCNNNFSSRFARWLIEEDPSFATLFKVRKLLAA